MNCEPKNDKKQQHRRHARRRNWNTKPSFIFYFNLIFFILLFILQFNNITRVIEYNYFDLVKKTVIHRWDSSKTNEKWKAQKQEHTKNNKTGSEIPILDWVATAAAAQCVLVSLEVGQQRAHFEKYQLLFTLIYQSLCVCGKVHFKCCLPSSLSFR